MVRGFLRFGLLNFLCGTKLFIKPCIYFFPAEQKLFKMDLTSLALSGRITYVIKQRGYKMTTITITWSAFSHATGDREGRTVRPETSMTIGLDTKEETDAEILNRLFHDFNTYSGIFKTFEECLPADRTHTALSIGDKIAIEHILYEIAPVGFKPIGLV